MPTPSIANFKHTAILEMCKSSKTNLGTMCLDPGCTVTLVV